MKLVSYDGGFGRVEDGAIVPMGDDLVRFLATGHVQDGTAVPLASMRLRAPVPRPGKVNSGAPPRLGYSAKKLRVQTSSGRWPYGKASGSIPRGITRTRLGSSQR